MSEPNLYAPPKADVEPVGQRVAEAPPLWNPGAAAGWSLLFSPTFGALVQMKNWQALGEPKKADAARVWAVSNVVVVLVLTVLSLIFEDSKALDGLSRVIGLVLVITWYYSNGKEQRGYVAARFGTNYPRRGWGIPILLGIAGLVALIAALVVVAIAVAPSGQF